MGYVTGIPTKDVPATWPKVSRFIASGLGEGETLERTYDRVMRRECALWVAKENDNIIAACVTEAAIICGRKICNVLALGGAGMDSWLGNLSTIEMWAAANDSVAMRIADCRPGWARVLKDMGYRIKYVVLEKAL